MISTKHNYDLSFFFFGWITNCFLFVFIHFIFILHLSQPFYNFNFFNIWLLDETCLFSQKRKKEDETYLWFYTNTTVELLWLNPTLTNVVKIKWGCIICIYVFLIKFSYVVVVTVHLDIERKSYDSDKRVIILL